MPSLHAFSDSLVLIKMLATNVNSFDFTILTYGDSGWGTGQAVLKKIKKLVLCELYKT